MIDDLQVYPAPTGVPLCMDFEVTVNGQHVDLYASATRYGNNASFGYFDFGGRVQIDIHLNFGAYHSNSVRVLPDGLGIHPEPRGGFDFSFTLEKPAQMTMIVNDDYQGRVLHLFASAIEADRPAADDSDVIYFGPGYHRLSGERAELKIQSGQTVYLAGGAVVVGRLTADHAENIAIRGRGVLVYDVPAQQGSQITLELIDCAEVRIAGIIVSRTAGGWTGLLTRCADVTVDDVKICSTAIWSTDGLNIMNCSRVAYRRCFFRCGDDNISIKGIYGGGPGSPRIVEDKAASPPNEDILISQCIFWSDNNNAVVVGPESIATYYRHIRVEDCDVLFCRDDEPIKAALAIICMHATDIEDVVFENIRIGPCGQAIAVFFADSLFGIPGELRKLRGVMGAIRFTDIVAWGAGSKHIRLSGHNDAVYIRDVTLEHVYIHGKRLDADSPYLETNAHVRQLVVR